MSLTEQSKGKRDTGNTKETQTEEDAKRDKQDNDRQLLLF